MGGQLIQTQVKTNSAAGHPIAKNDFIFWGILLIVKDKIALIRKTSGCIQPKTPNINFQRGFVVEFQIQFQAATESANGFFLPAQKIQHSTPPESGVFFGEDQLAYGSNRENYQRKQNYDAPFLKGQWSRPKDGTADEGHKNLYNSD